MSAPGAQRRKECKGMPRVFRYKKRIPVEYDRQGHIHFTTKRYKQLLPDEQKAIMKICREAAGDYAKAVLEYMSTDTPEVVICDKYHVSRATLERMVRRFYVAFDRKL